MPGPWHIWFAWHPVRTRSHGWKWLTYVYRRQLWTPQITGHSPDPFWQYAVREAPSLMISACAECASEIWREADRRYPFWFHTGPVTETHEARPFGQEHPS